MTSHLRYYGSLCTDHYATVLHGFPVSPPQASGEMMLKKQAPPRWATIGAPKHLYSMIKRELFHKNKNKKMEYPE